ncbi:DISARM system helicase DrmA [Hydrogenimonas urashimensis]|uniref:DISARM system helicase DrmA n=1 Tax=Hydrogenimonas urashimensis TaxID=2740515 RepID=UPI0019156BC4|nr:DISARM system helicase DrmA [Hydrogenimonas urashimensis]
MMPMNNTTAWILKITRNTILKRFHVTFRHTGSISFPDIEEGDAFLLVNDTDGIVAFARIYRIRETTKETTFYFDKIHRLDSFMSLAELGLESSPENIVVRRLGHDRFEEACRRACGVSFEEIPPIEGKDPMERAYIRSLLQLAVQDDLLGPAMGPHEEIIGMSVRERYLMGKLAPVNAKPEQTEMVELDSAEESNEDDSTKEVDTTSNQSLVPSSFGLTFCVDAAVRQLSVEAEWGRYERTESETKVGENEKPLRCWKRIPCGGKIVLDVKEGIVEPKEPDPTAPGVVIQGKISQPLENGDRLVTLFLVDTQQEPLENRDAAWVFQPKLSVSHPEGEAIFRRRPVLEESAYDPERETLETLYRKRVEFAIGHGVSVHAEVSEGNSERAMRVETVTMPEKEIAVTETPGLRDRDRPAMREMVEKGHLDMERLASMEVEALETALRTLTDDYARWIEENEARIDEELPESRRRSARDSMNRCREIHERLVEGVETLKKDERALEAFRFANRAMAEQRIHSIYTLKRRRGKAVDLDSLRVPGNRSWRAFQLAFLLLSVPALADPTHRDRTSPLEAYADLLWFPTGGGKTEAYLGVAAFAMGIRRLQGKADGYDATRGLGVIMRYTLRLLTIQQFQRATTLICAMEVERRRNPEKWGEEPFRIGLWVGQKVTPNTTEEAHRAIEEIRNGKKVTASSPTQLSSCPWCGSEIAPGRDIEVDKDRTRTVLYCGDPRGKCDFSRRRSPGIGVPVVVVDEELYRRPPSMLIATVDKFAQMAWKGEVRTLFGKATMECPRHGLIAPDSLHCGDHRKKGRSEATKARPIDPLRPPDLVIQDEFHLISGPLGTMVGLYETAVDDACSWECDGKRVRPKIVASTATVRKADEQVKNVFVRRVSIFPPSGIDIEDNFFSVQRPTNEVPGRKYVGIFSAGSSRPAMLIRVYVALLTAAQELAERFGEAADPYMTLVGYFNSLRELGGMRRLAEDDVRTRSYKVRMDRNIERPHLAQRDPSTIVELTSRVASADIPKMLDELEKPFVVERADGDGWKVVKKGKESAVDIVLATNMLSVGVDVDRIGLMVVNGQPKNTAEYIQATSRVGRSYPGIVYTVLTWARPRDLSHYETFEHYHDCFYKHVEAQSVTPFSPRAMDRGLTGTMVSMARTRYEELAPNEGAGELKSPSDSRIVSVEEEIVARMERVKDVSAGQLARSMMEERVDRWTKEANEKGRRLGYDVKRKKGEVAALLKRPGVEPWDIFTVPTSMREVEPGVRLVLEERTLQESDMPTWRIRERKGENDGR